MVFSTMGGMLGPIIDAVLEEWWNWNSAAETMLEPIARAMASQKGCEGGFSEVVLDVTKG